MTEKRLYHPGSYMVFYDSYGEFVFVEEFVTNDIREVNRKLKRIKNQYGGVGEEDFDTLVFKIKENIKCDEYTLGSLVIHIYDDNLDDLEALDVPKSYISHILEAIDRHSIRVI